MKNILYLFLLLFFSCTSDSAKNQKSTSSWSNELTVANSAEITCWGVGDIELEDSFDILAEKAGEKNVKQDSLFKEGTFEGFITRIWGNTEKEIIVHWKEKTPPFSAIKQLEITNPSSIYHFPNGIKIGTTLTELIELNGGKEFSFYGFGWDYGGTVNDFNGGKLSEVLPCFKGKLALPEGTSSAAELKEIMGDHLVKSSLPVFSKYVPKLVNIKISNVD